MSWLRYSDGFTTDRSWDAVGYEARWHYFAMVEDCSRARRWDGRLPLNRARRVSDVSDPDKCIGELTDAGWVRVTDDTVVIVIIDSHVAPAGQRDENLKPRQAQNSAAYRQRKCERGEHSRYCSPKSCPVKLTRARVNGRVTDDTGTGRDEELTEERNQEQGPTTDLDEWPPVRPAADSAWADTIYDRER